MKNNVKEKFFQLQDELKKAKSQTGRDAIQAELYRLFEEDPQAWSEAYDEGLTDLRNRVEAVSIKQQLSPIFEIIRARYVAEHYLARTAGWFSQRLNGNKVAGTLVAFKPEELTAIEEAIHDIGRTLLDFKIKR